MKVINTDSLIRKRLELNTRFIKQLLCYSVMRVSTQIVLKSSRNDQIVAWGDELTLPITLALVLTFHNQLCWSGTVSQGSFLQSVLILLPPFILSAVSYSPMPA